VTGVAAVRPVGGPAAWRGPDQARSDDWIVALSDAEQAALAAAPAADLAPLAALGGRVRRELLDGRGFLVLRGLPVDGRTEDALEAAYTRLGTAVGVPVPQDGAGRLLVHVRDQGLDYTDPHVRGYQTRARLDYHVDGSDVVALLCRRAARSGGASTIVSSVAVHDEVVRRAPALAALLHEPVWFDRRTGDGPDSFYRHPVFSFDRGRLVTYSGRSYIESAQRGPHVDRLTADHIAAFDLLDELTNAPEFFLSMDLQPGDVQFLDNRVIMHARTDYEDWPEPDRKRDMVRLWLSLGAGEPAVMVPGAPGRA
jgi:hypothetical protein